jgi:hypothetical protein
LQPAGGQFGSKVKKKDKASPKDRPGLGPSYGQFSRDSSVNFGYNAPVPLAAETKRGRDAAADSKTNGASSSSSRQGNRNISGHYGNGYDTNSGVPSSSSRSNQSSAQSTPVTSRQSSIQFVHQMTKEEKDINDFGNQPAHLASSDTKAAIAMHS